LKGRYSWNKRTLGDLNAAISYFNQAIAADPNYALAYSGMADVYAVLPPFGGGPEAIPKSNAAARRALELDPSLARPHAVLAFSKIADWDFAGGEAEFRRALELDPNFFLGYYFRGRAYEQKGMLPEAMADFRKAIALYPGSPALRMALGHASALSGDKPQARKLLADLVSLSSNRYVPAVYMVGVAAGLDDKNEAFRWLSQAVQDRCDYVVYLRHEPGLDNLRSDPRFPEILRQIGLSP